MKVAQLVRIAMPFVLFVLALGLMPLQGPALAQAPTATVPATTVPAGTTPAAVQNYPRYIQFSPSAVKGALYVPSSGPAPHVGVLLMHRTSNFLSHLATTELANRGFMVLAMNPRFDNNEASVRFEDIALDVKQGLDFLKKQPGITKVVLFGHSGGGPTMSYYEAVAENGPGYCQGSNKLSQCNADALKNLVKADGLVLVDAHPGNTINALRSFSPGVDEATGKVSPELDPFNPANGYNPKGPSTYSDAFKQAYFKAQSDRMNKLIDDAQAKMKQIEAGTYRYPDDDAFVVVKGDGARLMQLDLSIDHGTLKPQKLLKNDGTVVTQVVESVRLAQPKLAADNASFADGTRFLTLRSFLSANAIRSTNSMDGIDYCSSNNSTPCALSHITLPVLITAMGAHYFIRDSEIHYEVSTSPDKDFVVVEGATHSITPCTACEKTKGDYSNSVKNFFDYVSNWINKRF